MIRAIAEAIFLFLLPFAGFAIWLLTKGFNPLEPASWSRSALSSLTIVALGLCIVSVVFVGATRQHEQGVFVPSHVKDGQFVPGHFR